MGVEVSGDGIGKRHPGVGGVVEQRGRRLCRCARGGAEAARRRAPRRSPRPRRPRRAGTDRCCGSACHEERSQRAQPGSQHVACSGSSAASRPAASGLAVVDVRVDPPVVGTARDHVLGGVRTDARALGPRVAGPIASNVDGQVAVELGGGCGEVVRQNVVGRPGDRGRLRAAAEVRGSLGGAVHGERREARGSGTPTGTGVAGVCVGVHGADGDPLPVEHGLAVLGGRACGAAAAGAARASGPRTRAEVATAAEPTATERRVSIMVASKGVVRCGSSTAQPPQRAVRLRHSLDRPRRYRSGITPSGVSFDALAAGRARARRSREAGRWRPSGW